jgi:hypothetical protein
MTNVIQAALSVTEKAAATLYDEFTADTPFELIMLMEADYDAIEAIHIWVRTVAAKHAEEHGGYHKVIEALRNGVFYIQMLESGTVFTDVSIARGYGLNGNEIFACYLGWDAGDLSGIGLFTTLGPDTDWDLYSDEELRELGPFSLLI